MNIYHVGTLCQRLTAYQLKTIWASLTNVVYGTRDLTDGEVLVFCTADFLMGTGLLDQDRLQLWLDIFRAHVEKIGDQEWIGQKEATGVKIGFLDRCLAVADGCAVFLNLEDGSTTKAIHGLRPTETISYDLCAIWQSYQKRLAATPKPAMVALPRRPDGEKG
jgi:hypothetical protein